MLFLSSWVFAEEGSRIIVSGPPGGLVSLPVYRMIEEDVLAEDQYSIEFLPWKNPDQLRAIIASGQADFVALPTNVAANFYNRGVNLKLLNVSLWSILWIVSDDAAVHSLDDLKGQEILVPFKDDLPEIIFMQTARQLGFHPEDDFQIRYVGHALDAAHLLLLGQAHHALIPEPKCSIALNRARHDSQGDKGIVLHRSIDMQAEWGKAFQGESRIALAGVAVIGKQLKSSEMMNRFHESYTKALEWCKANPVQAGRLMHERNPVYDPEVVADSIRAAGYFSIASNDARPDLEHFFQVLQSQDPAKIGNRMPDEKFYWKP